MNLITDWFKHHFSNPQVVFLSLLLLGITAIIVLFGNILGPVLASVVLAYVLEGAVKRIQALGVNRILAVCVVFVLFVFALFAIMLWLIPLLTAQISELVQQVPQFLQSGQAALMRLPERYPELVSEEQVRQVSRLIGAELTIYGQKLVAYSVSSFRNIVSIMIFLIVMPILVFLFLKDKERIINWFTNFMPKDRQLTSKIWRESNAQFSNYMRGKFFEILVVTIVSAVTFVWLDLQYAALLAVAVGLSVLVPYVGAAVVTIPVLLIGWFQWGWSLEFGYVAIAYFVIQALDGNLLVPWLFSEVVNMHPVAIIVAVVFFGGVWGIWGVFFAIPLATLVQAIIRAWPEDQKLTDIK